MYLWIIKTATKIILKQGLKADIVAHVRAIKSDVDIAIDCDATWVATYLGISDIHLIIKTENFKGGG